VKEVVESKPVTILVPVDSAIIENRQSGPIKYVTYRTEEWGASQNSQWTTEYKGFDGKTFTVHRRNHNGTAGSGVIYTVSYDTKDTPELYQYTFRAVLQEQYQQGLILPFPVPNFTVQELYNALLSFEIPNRFEIASPYPAEAVYANFVRLAQQRPGKGTADPVTGKIYRNWFAMDYRNRKVEYAVETFPYRVGSKAIIYVRTPAILTSPDTVDFRTIFIEIKEGIAKIAGS
jgi:hypothetical protein